jgi:hypothetical protein
MLYPYCPTCRDFKMVRSVRSLCPDCDDELEDRDDELEDRDDYHYHYQPNNNIATLNLYTPPNSSLKSSYSSTKHMLQFKDLYKYTNLSSKIEYKYRELEELYNELYLYFILAWYPDVDIGDKRIKNNAMEFKKKCSSIKYKMSKDENLYYNFKDYFKKKEISREELKEDLGKNEKIYMRDSIQPISRRIIEYIGPFNNSHKSKTHVTKRISSVNLFKQVLDDMGKIVTFIQNYYKQFKQNNNTKLKCQVCSKVQLNNTNFFDLTDSILGIYITRNSQAATDYAETFISRNPRSAFDIYKSIDEFERSWNNLESKILKCTDCDNNVFGEKYNYLFRKPTLRNINNNKLSDSYPCRKCGLCFGSLPAFNTHLCNFKVE